MRLGWGSGVFIGLLLLLIAVTMLYRVVTEHLQDALIVLTLFTVTIIITYVFGFIARDLPRHIRRWTDDES